ncbi:hypothetical protein OPKNFCMD_6534 [Methylobacterium crusticola]|uniref:Integral membrane bound transporter domain-containing protein n=1 Tax=Methylobacterium crusticola TaxID=1697972 RepID=A0ABQ4R8U8_9HYPH|nr:FUSC family protein [Methylobacterium crusticola]GJD53756.1 hypothetical protein OPKNFCMD_6534 [Methylobacterium crusticola]
MTISTRDARAALARSWSELLASDPGGLRFRSACRTTLCVAVTALVFVPFLVAHELPVAAPAVAVVLALMSASLPREPAPRQRLATILAMAAAAAATTVLGALLAAQPLLGQAAFLAILFGAIALQSWGPRAVAVGLTAVVNTYLVLFLRAEPGHLLAILPAVPVAVAIVAVVSFVVVPERPLAAARRVVRAVERQGARLVHASLSAARDRGTPSRLRLRRLFGVLNESILMVEDHIAAVDAEAGEALSLALLRFELALISLSAGLMAAQPMSRREAALTRLLALRLAAGRRTQLRTPLGRPETPLGTAVTDVDDAALGVARTLEAVSGRLARKGPAGAAGPGGARQPPAWRPAIRAVTAAFLSMVGGHLASPDRWFWAVLTAYLVFLGARSSGDTIHKGAERVGGTLVGLVAGVVVSVALAGHPVLEVSALLVCIFALAYVFAISQVLAIFCVTIILGLVYSLLGTPAETILVLRLEETAIGAAAAVLVSLYVLPAPTHAHVHRVGGDLVSALARVLRVSARRLAGDAAATPVAEIRRADRLLRDLRAALRPLRAHHAFVWWARRPSELPAILACVFWVRVLAMISVADPAEVDRSLVPAKVDALADRLEAFASARGPEPESAPARRNVPLEIGVAHIGRARAVLLDLAIANLEGIVGLMRDRLHHDGWGALVSRRPL